MKFESARGQTFPGPAGLSAALLHSGLELGVFLVVKNVAVPVVAENLDLFAGDVPFSGFHGEIEIGESPIESRAKSVAFSKDAACVERRPGRVNDESDNPNFVMESVEDLIRKRAKQDFPKVEIDGAVNLTVLTEVGKAAKKGVDESIAQSMTRVFIAPASNLNDVGGHGRKDPNFPHRRD